MSKTASTSVPLNETLAVRWSPRVFDPQAVLDDECITAILEAGRWTPSANNLQPWAFIVGTRGSDTFEAIYENLKGYNKEWAHRASALIVNLVDTRAAADAGAPDKFNTYDLGQAVAHMTFQAQLKDWFVHQVGGVNAEPLAEALSIEPHFEIFTVSAIGKPVDPATTDGVSEELLARETAPRSRKALDQIVLKRG